MFAGVFHESARLRQFRRKVAAGKLRCAARECIAEIDNYYGRARPGPDRAAIAARIIELQYLLSG
jgi:hypothetical protein